MHIFQALDLIKKRPGMYLGGEKSLQRLRDFIVLLCEGAVGGNYRVFGMEDLAAFEGWIARELGYSSQSHGWYDMIMDKTESGGEAYDKFFQLLDEFRGQKGSTPPQPES